MSRKQEKLCEASIGALSLVAEEMDDHGADVGTVVAAFAIALGRMLAAHYDEEQTVHLLGVLEEYTDQIRQCCECGDVN